MLMIKMCLSRIMSSSDQDQCGKAVNVKCPVSISLQCLSEIRKSRILN